MPKMKFSKKGDKPEDVKSDESITDIDITVEEDDSEDIIDDSENKKSFDELKKQRDEAIDKMQRLAAEFDNFRKRTLKEKASMYDDGAKDTLEKLLPVLDNFERAVIDAEKHNENDPVTKGIVMILKQFKEILSGIGVVEIEALGKQFDPNMHFAVAHEENEDSGANEIVDVMQKGYMYKEKVLRCSMVKVVN